MADKIITITPRAIQKIKELMESKGLTGYGLRFSIEKAGHVSYVYNMDFEKKPTKDEIVIEENSLKIFIPKGNLKLLEGCRIEYIEADGGFKIINPHVKSS